MTEQEFNKRVKEVLANYSVREASTLEDAYHHLLCNGIMLNSESIDNFELLLAAKANYLNSEA